MHEHFPDTKSKTFQVYFTDCWDLEDENDSNNPTVQVLNQIYTNGVSIGDFDCNKIAAIVCSDYLDQFDNISVLYHKYLEAFDEKPEYRRKLEHAFRLIGDGKERMTDKMRQGLTAE